MERIEQLERLQCISEAEWKKALKSLGVYIIRQIRGRTLYGAHSESVLGMSPVDYYTGEAVEALFTGKWKWKEDVSLEEQLKSIARSKISAQVQKYRTRKDILSPYDLGEAETKVTDEDEESKEMYEICMAAAKGDDELELYVQAVHDNNSFKDICSNLGISDPKLVYNLQRKLKRRIKSIKDNEL